jgi:beta-galactosidase
MRSNLLLVAVMCLLSVAGVTSRALAAGDRIQMLLSDSTWQYAGSATQLPEIGTPAFDQQNWTDVRVPHVFQTREAMTAILRAWYRKDISLPPEATGKHLYLVFEGAASIADVYVNGKHLGQHRGAYTRYVVDATDAFHPGDGNTIAVNVDNDPADTTDCLPSKTRLYTVWGGIYRKVWLVAVDPLHIDPTDYSSPGVYITPANVTDDGADLAVKVLLRNAGALAETPIVRGSLIDPSGTAVLTLSNDAQVNANGKTSVELTGHVSRPQLWFP